VSSLPRCDAPQRAQAWPIARRCSGERPTAAHCVYRAFREDVSGPQGQARTRIPVGWEPSNSRMPVGDVGGRPLLNFRPYIGLQLQPRRTLQSWPGFCDSNGNFSYALRPELAYRQCLTMSVVANPRVCRLSLMVAINNHAVGNPDDHCLSAPVNSPTCGMGMPQQDAVSSC